MKILPFLAMLALALGCSEPAPVPLPVDPTAQFNAIAQRAVDAKAKWDAVGTTNTGQWVTVTEKFDKFRESSALVKNAISQNQPTGELLKVLETDAADLIKTIDGFL